MVQTATIAVNRSAATVAALSPGQLHRLGYAAGFNTGVQAAVGQVQHWIVIAAAALVVYTVATRLRGTRFDRDVLGGVTSVVAVVESAAFMALAGSVFALLMTGYMDPIEVAVQRPPPSQVIGAG